MSASPSTAHRTRASQPYAAHALICGCEAFVKPCGTSGADWRPRWAHDNANRSRGAVLLQGRGAHRYAYACAICLLRRDVEQVAVRKLGLAGLEDLVVA